jgi:hypothetical protein
MVQQRFIFLLLMVLTVVAAAAVDILVVIPAAVAVREFLDKEMLEVRGVPLQLL